MNTTLAEIRDELVMSVGVTPTDEDDKRLSYTTGGETIGSLMTTEVRVIDSLEMLSPSVQIWYQDDETAPFIKVAEFTQVLDVSAMGSFIQQFAALGF